MFAVGVDTDLVASLLFNRNSRKEITAAHAMPRRPMSKSLLFFDPRVDAASGMYCGDVGATTVGIDAGLLTGGREEALIVGSRGGEESGCAGDICDCTPITKGATRSTGNGADGS